jgi:hypothetical protein
MRRVWNREIAIEFEIVLKNIMRYGVEKLAEQHKKRKHHAGNKSIRVGN